jgi:uncharacterized protein
MIFQRLEEIEKKQLALNSIPQKMLIHSLELDLTWDCNLKCVYCYKGERRQTSIFQKTAIDAIIWLFFASSHTKNISLFFMGGEPLLQFELIKSIVPFARRRAREQGKQLKISTTTNCTLVTHEVLDFFRTWNIGFHTSVDGISIVQNHNRPTYNGGETIKIVSQTIPKILKIKPNTTARATVIPENVDYLFDSYIYFRGLGYTSIVMVPTDSPNWTSDILTKYETQIRQIAEFWKNELQQGVNVETYFFPRNFQGRKITQRPSRPCGAGRGLVSIDVFGNIWPCNRWNTHGNDYWEQWCLGNIYQEFSENARTYFIDGNPPTGRCTDCTGKIFCGGGCHASNIETTNNIKIQHENTCQLSRIHARIALDLYDDLYSKKNPTFMRYYFPEEWKCTNDPQNIKSEAEQKK